MGRVRNAAEDKVTGLVGGKFLSHLNNLAPTGFDTAERIRQ